MSGIQQKAADPRGPIVVKIGGRGVQSPGDTPALWEAVRDLHRAERGEGRAGVILVHGGGDEADRLLGRLGMSSVRREGLRVTPPEQMEVIAGVLGGRVNKAIVGALGRAGQPAVGLCPGECGSALVERLTRGGNDLGLVGTVVGGDPSLVRVLLSSGIVPVFAPVGIDAGGGFLNINADDAAAGLAWVCRASLLILLTDVPGLLDRAGSLIERVNAGRIEALISDGVIRGGMVPKARAALTSAVMHGVCTVIAGWDDPGLLTRIARGQPAGTRIDVSDVPHLVEESSR